MPSKPYTVHIVTNTWDDLLIRTMATNPTKAVNFASEEAALEMAFDDDAMTIENARRTFRIFRVWEGNFYKIPTDDPIQTFGTIPQPPTPGTCIRIHDMICEITDAPPDDVTAGIATEFTVAAKTYQREKLAKLLDGRHGQIISNQPYGRVLVYCSQPRS